MTSPTPWFIRKWNDPKTPETNICGADKVTVSDVCGTANDETDTANAQLIVAAVNAYEAQRECITVLVNAVEKLIDVTYTRAIEEGDKDVQMARIHGRAALAKAKGLL